MQPPIPLVIIKDLKCRHCLKFMSCGPVFVVPDGGVLCGRCRTVAKANYQNLCYEALASMYCYPCCHWSKHCHKSLTWNQSPDHERNCLFQSSCRLFFAKPGAWCSSERKISLIEDHKLEHVPDDVLEALKCLACENYLSCEPVYLSSDGKNVCHRCVTSNGIPNGCIRNVAFELLASTVIFPCIYRFRGCTMRYRFGRDMWNHERECSYGQLNHFPKKGVTKNGKERGVIQTHSGHIYGTITPLSAPFSPPKNRNNEGQMLTHEIESVIKRKNTESIDSQSVDSMGDYLSRTSSIIRDSTRDDFAVSTREDDLPPSGSSSMVGYNPRENQDLRSSIQHEGNYPPARASNGPRAQHEIMPVPAPIGYNKMAKYSYEDYDNVDLQYQFLYHFPPIASEANSNLNYSPSFNQAPRNSVQNEIRRSESLRPGNKEMIDELKLRQNKKQSERQKQANEESETVATVL